MALDGKGNEVQPGDVVAVLFEVTNVVSDSERLNLVVRHFHRHHGLPDDWRLQLSSAHVAKISPEGVEQLRPVLDPEPAPAAAE